ncbi:histidinol dehydrogenase [Candidatus Vidania fulgoroideorum]
MIIFSSNKFKKKTQYLNLISLHNVVNRIIKYVIKYGDDGIVKLTKKYDFKKNFKKNEIVKSIKNFNFNILKKSYKRFLVLCRNNILKFHKKQVLKIGFKNWFIKTGSLNLSGQTINPIKRIGVYIPGGKRIYPSSVFMNCIPAIIAGVKRIYVTTPANVFKEESLPLIYALKLMGIKKFYNLGGAQAIAAFAFGTKRVRKVHKIIGPGNKFVNIAKKTVFGTVGIDIPAGPSEVGLLVRKKDNNTKKIAYELFSQIEHDRNCLSYVVSESKKSLYLLINKIRIFLRINSNNKIYKTLKISIKNTIFIYEKNIYKAIAILNVLSPEHISFLPSKNIKNSFIFKNFGAIIQGKYSSQALSDFSLGTNHVIPTRRCGIFSSVLNVSDFLLIRNSSLTLRKDHLKRYIAKGMSKIENLFFHFKSAGL